MAFNPVHRTTSSRTAPADEDRGDDFDFSINGLLINPFRGKEQPEMEALVSDFMEVGSQET